MTSATLYIFQTQYRDTLPQLEKFQSLLTQSDRCIFLGESLQALLDSEVDPSHFYALDSEFNASLHGENISMQMIDYAAFADLCLQFTRCISLK